MFEFRDILLFNYLEIFTDIYVEINTLSIAFQALTNIADRSNFDPP